jgi:hypothetical protein
VLAVGAVDVHSGALEPTSGRGPTTDNRIKPDITGPTGVYVASSASDVATKHFYGTSCALPFAAGLAFNARSYFFDYSGRDSVDPGRVYALMLMTGPGIHADE